MGARVCSERQQTGLAHGCHHVMFMMARRLRGVRLARTWRNALKRVGEATAPMSIRGHALDGMSAHPNSGSLPRLSCVRWRSCGRCGPMCYLKV